LGLFCIKGHISSLVACDLHRLEIRISKFETNSNDQNTKFKTSHGYPLSRAQVDYLQFTNLGLLALSPCCAAAYDMQTEMSSSPAGGLSFAFWQTWGEF